MDLETSRLYLRDLTTDDLDPLTRLDADPNVMRYIGDGSTRTREEVRQGLERVIAYGRDHAGLGLFGTVVRETGEFIGWTALKHMVPLRLMEDAKYARWKEQIEIGYRYLHSSWGRGYATEAARALLSYGFKDLGLRQIDAIVTPENAASIRVLEKIGLEKLGPDDYGGWPVLHYRKVDGQTK